MKKYVCAIILATSVSTAAAQDYYISGGYSIFDTDVAFIGFSPDTKPSAIDLRLGMRANPRFALEGNIALGVSDDNLGNTSINFELDKMFGISGVGIIPVSDIVDVYTKFGVASVEYENSNGDTGDGSGFTFGLGAIFKPTDQFSVFLDYTQLPDGEYDDIISNIESNVLTLGLSFAI